MIDTLLLQYLHNAHFAAVRRAYAIRPYNYFKTIIAHSFPNTPKNTFDVRKTT